MDEDDSWWFCLKHHQVEHGPGCAGKDRLGPYPTEDAAAHALETVRRRNEEWDAQDDWGSANQGNQRNQGS